MPTVAGNSLVRSYHPVCFDKQLPPDRFWLTQPFDEKSLDQGQSHGYTNRKASAVTQGSYQH